MDDRTLRFLLACQAGAIVASLDLRDDGDFAAAVLCDTAFDPPPMPEGYEEGDVTWLGEKATEWVNYRYQGRGHRRNPERPLERVPRPDWMGG